jgi:hypothetical protein
MKNLVESKFTKNFRQIRIIKKFPKIPQRPKKYTADAGFSLDKTFFVYRRDLFWKFCENLYNQKVFGAEKIFTYKLFSEKFPGQERKKPKNFSSHNKKVIPNI